MTRRRPRRPSNGTRRVLSAGAVGVAPTLVGGIAAFGVWSVVPNRPMLTLAVLLFVSLLGYSILGYSVIFSRLTGLEGP